MNDERPMFPFWFAVTGLLVLGLLSGCGKDKPPVIEICILDGIGGECDVPGVGKVNKTPSQLTNYWATNQDDMAKFASWCYGLKGTSASKKFTPERAKQFLEMLKEDIKKK